MKHARFIAAIVVVGGSLAFVISSATQASKREVVTVAKLVSSRATTKPVRLGARVADVPFQYETSPLMLRFSVHDRDSTDTILPIVFHGPMPETLRVDRDVLVEGRYDGNVFQAEVLQTQCPSKYEPPPVPGTRNVEPGSAKK